MSHKKIQLLFCMRRKRVICDDVRGGSAGFVYFGFSDTPEVVGCGLAGASADALCARGEPLAFCFDGDGMLVVSLIFRSASVGGEAAAFELSALLPAPLLKLLPMPPAPLFGDCGDFGDLGDACGGTSGGSCARRGLPGGDAASTAGGK